MKKLLFILSLFIISKINFASCNFTVSNTTVCAGDVITISLQEPYGDYHKILILRNNLSQATEGTEYEILKPYLVTDNEIKIVFRGNITTKQYYIALTENPLLDVACGNKLVSITVNSSPDPQLEEAGDFKVCNSPSSAQTLTFTNVSTTIANNTNYTINWGDGTPNYIDATFSNSVTHSYSPGSYTLTFTVNSSGTTCNTATKIYNVLIGKGPTIVPTISGNTPCAPSDYTLPLDIAQMLALNSDNTFYKLYIDGELIETYDNSTIPLQITHFFEEGSCGNSSDCPQTNFYSIRMVSENECDFADFQQCVIVKDSIEPEIQGKDTVCINSLETWRNIDPKSKKFVGSDCNQIPDHTWNIIPNTGFTTTNNLGTPEPKNTLNVTFTQTGDYQITLTVDGDCNTEDTTYNIYVDLPNTSDATYTAPACIPNNIGYVDVDFTNTSTGNIQSYSWSVSGGAQFVNGTTASSKDVTIRFSNGGTYTVSMTANGTCTPPAWTTQINFKSPPTITPSNFDTICFVPAVFNPFFKFTFDKGGDANTSYNWQFDGAIPSSSSVENPGQITYTNAGDYTVFVELVNQCGNDSIRVPFNIQDNPKPDAGADFSTCKSASNIILTGTPSGGVWSGQGFVNVNSGEWSPSSFANTGTYDLEYTINQNGACPTKDTVQATITEIVGLTAGPDQTVCKPDLLELEGDPNFTGGNWIGTGVVNSSTGIFNASGLTPGNYSVGYVFQDASGTCSDTAYKIVTVYDSIHVSNNILDLCVGQSFDFGTITGNMISALWDFGDGTPLGIITNPKHTYTSAGTYTVELQAETADGCKDTVFFTVNVIQNPDLSFIITPDSTCTGQNVAFSFPPTHQATNNYLWSFGVSTISDNAPNTQVVDFPVPSFADTLYPIVLKAKYYCGDVYAYDTVKVKAPAYAAFSVQTVACSPFQPQLTNQSYGTPTNFYWDFGNGQTSNLANPIAPTYINTTNRDTTYTITLTASNICGNSTVSKTITVLGNQVEASFFTDITQGCEPLTVSFYSTSTVGTNQTWTFGDGNQAFGDQAVNTFVNDGTYNVKLLATSTCGKDSAYTTIKVLQKPTASFTVGATCVNSPTQFNNASTSANAYQWNFGDGDASSIKNPTHIYTNTGSYVVTMHAFNSNGCKDSTQLAIGVSTKPTADFDVPFPNVCLDEAIQFVNNSVSANSFLWNFGNGETSTVAAPNYVYPAAGTYTVSLLAINGSCRDSITKPAVAEVYPNPLADFIAYITDNGFEDPVEFTNTTAFGNEYLWVFGDGDSSVEVSPIHQYEFKKPNYKVYLYVLSEHGCADTVIKIIGYEYDGTLFVPNVLAPELGAGNESSIFMPKGFNLKEYHIEIFSTYGQLLWESTALVDGQPAEGWDGTYKGKLLPQDVYVWKIRAIYENGQAWEGMASPEDIKNPPADLSKVKKRTMGSLLLIR